MVKIVFGILLAIGVGAGCRWLELPVPAPPKLLGALLIVAITLGYIGADKVLSRREVQSRVDLSQGNRSDGSGT